VIVTCPGCGSKYRVRDEAVPQGGAELKCPSCSSVFMAHPPKHSDAEIQTALEKMTRAKESADERAAALEKDRAELERRAGEADRRALEAEARLQQAEAQVIVLKSELTSMQHDARASLVPLESEIQRLREEAARANARANAASEAELRVLSLTEELARARAAANHAPEVARLTDELNAAQRGAGRLRTDVEMAQQEIAKLTQQLAQQAAQGAGDNGMQSQLEAELMRLRDQMSNQATVPPGPALSPTLASLIAAVGPLLWGLEQTVKYLEPFGQAEPALAGHIKQLQLVHGVLTRLTKEAAAAGV
jgi:predicted Zn finger-like uncharacterized protein